MSGAKIRPNEYVCVSVGLFDNPKLADLADEHGPDVYAVWVYVLCRAKAAKHLGRVIVKPTRIARMVGISPPSRATDIVNGLVEKRCLTPLEGADHYQIRNWARWQSMTGSERVRRHRMKREAEAASTEHVSGLTQAVTDLTQQEESRVEERRETNSAGAGAKQAEAVRAVFEHWKQLEESTVGKAPDGSPLPGIRNPKLTAGRRERINARLAEGYTIEELQECIDAFLADGWHLGANDRGTRYTDLPTILKNASKVDAGRAKHAAQQQAKTKRVSQLVRPQSVPAHG